MADAQILHRAGSFARRRPIELAALLLGVAAISAWIYSGVRNALVELAANNLRSLLASEVVTIDAWIGEKRLNVRRWASDPRLLSAAETVLRAAERGAENAELACRGEAGARLIAVVDTLRQPDAAAAVFVTDRNGRIVAARDTARCGVVLAAAERARLAPVLAGETRFTGTLTDTERVGGEVAGNAIPAQRVWIAAPVRDATGTVIAVLDIGKPAEDRFSPLFEGARSGDAGEAYAFDVHGHLLTASRFRSALEQAGRIRVGENPIGLRLLDPAIEFGESQLTLLIRRALAARANGELSGAVLQPYRNYIGEPVIGAWRWLDQYGFGIAVEQAEREAFAPLARLETAFFVLGSMVGVAVFGLLVALLRMYRMQQEVEEAQRVGNYELLEEIGKGGFATVYRARHRLLKRPTAVKIIELRVATDEVLARFDREAKLASQLSHPNTVEIFDFGRTREGQPFFAMEYLDGLTLQQVVERQGALPAPRVAHVLRGIAGSLAEAHARGLVHRDIKPANVMLCRRGGEFDVVKVLDFGLVKDTHTQATRDLTHALRVLGTPAYMAPERIEHPDGADFRSDLYALGAVGSFLLRGQAPFEGESDLALAYQVVNTPAPPLGDHVPTALASLVMRCLQKSPETRPQSATAIIRELDLVLARVPWSFVEARAWWEAHDHAPDNATRQANEVQPASLPARAS